MMMDKTWEEGQLKCCQRNRKQYENTKWAKQKQNKIDRWWYMSLDYINRWKKACKWRQPWLKHCRRKTGLMRGLLLIRAKEPKEWWARNDRGSLGARTNRWKMTKKGENEAWRVEVVEVMEDEGDGWWYENDGWQDEEDRKKRLKWQMVRWKWRMMNEGEVNPEVVQRSRSERADMKENGFNVREDIWDSSCLGNCFRHLYSTGCCC